MTEKIQVEGGVDIHSWCPTIEDQALEQMGIIARLPYVKYCALMPDAHLGMDMPIGGVVATKGVIVPNFCGVDIGCGMCAVKSNLTVDDLDGKKMEIFNLLSQAIPTGFNHNPTQRINWLKKSYEPKLNFMVAKSNVTIDNEFSPNRKFGHDFYSQIGTLGGGNHFIEVQHDEEGHIWIMIHSGSRNIGKRIGDLYNDIARDLNAKWFSNASEIPFLPTDTEQGKMYLQWMDLAMRFAFLNRATMMQLAQGVFEQLFNKIRWVVQKDVEDDVNGMINIHHNFASIENHHNQNFWVHRKGATRASPGMTGIIPGSMGTASYITKGLGNARSLMSSSHGAGRKMGRMAFSRLMENSYDAVEDALKGVVHSDFGTFSHGKVKGLKDVSEAPGAYKDIDDVMANQIDLVESIVKLKPLISVKG